MNEREHRAIVRGYRDAFFNGANHREAIGVLVQAAQIAIDGGPRAVRQFMAAQGFPQNGAWCGQFAAAVVRSTGGRPPENPEVASSWRNFGTRSTTPHVGDIAVRIGQSSYNPGNRVPTGATGSHVTFVGGIDPRTGMFTGIGGNQGMNRYQPTTAGQYPISGFEFRTPSPTPAPATPGDYGLSMELSTPTLPAPPANWNLNPTLAKYSDQNFDLGPSQYFDPVTNQVTQAGAYAPNLDWNGIPASPGYTPLSQFGIAPNVDAATFDASLFTPQTQGLAYGNAPAYQSNAPEPSPFFGDLPFAGAVDSFPGNLTGSPTGGTALPDFQHQDVPFYDFSNLAPAWNPSLGANVDPFSLGSTESRPTDLGLGQLPNESPFFGGFPATDPGAADSFPGNLTGSHTDLGPSDAQRPMPDLFGTPQRDFLGEWQNAADKFGAGNFYYDAQGNIVGNPFAGAEAQGSVVEALPATTSRSDAGAADSFPGNLTGSPTEASPSGVPALPVTSPLFNNFPVVFGPDGRPMFIGGGSPGEQVFFNGQPLGQLSGSQPLPDWPGSGGPGHFVIPYGTTNPFGGQAGVLDPSFAPRGFGTPYGSGIGDSLVGSLGFGQGLPAGGWLRTGFLAGDNNRGIRGVDVAAIRALFK